MIETLIQRNEDRKLALARRIVNASRLRPGSTVAVLGVAFKARTDDVRDSAALTVIPALQQKSMVVRAHDPQAMQQGARQLRDVDWCRDAYHAAAGADAVVVLTEWEEYRKLDLERLARSMSGTLLFDYRNLFAPEKVLASGLDYVGVGRPARHVTSSNGKSRLAAAAF